MTLEASRRVSTQAEVCEACGPGEAVHFASVSVLLNGLAVDTVSDKRAKNGIYGKEAAFPRTELRVAFTRSSRNLIKKRQPAKPGEPLHPGRI